MTKKHSRLKKIFVGDTDCGGMVYHANYLRYMEEVRSDWLSEIGHSLTSLSEQGLIFVVKHIEIDYKKPAKLEDTIAITASINNISNSSIIFDQYVYKHENPSYVICEAKVTLVCINKQIQPVRIPDFLRELQQ